MDCMLDMRRCDVCWMRRMESECDDGVVSAWNDSKYDGVVGEEEKKE